MSCHYTYVTARKSRSRESTMPLQFVGNLHFSINNNWLHMCHQTIHSCRSIFSVLYYFSFTSSYRRTVVQNYLVFSHPQNPPHIEIFNVFSPPSHTQVVPPFLSLSIVCRSSILLSKYGPVCHLPLRSSSPNPGPSFCCNLTISLYGLVDT